MLNLLILARLADALEAAARRLADLYAIVLDAHATAARFESLAQMSDAELARRGLSREGLAQAVFAAEA